MNTPTPGDFDVGDYVVPIIDNHYMAAGGYVAYVFTTHGGDNCFRFNRTVDPIQHAWLKSFFCKIDVVTRFED